MPDHLTKKYHGVLWMCANSFNILYIIYIMSSFAKSKTSEKTSAKTSNATSKQKRKRRKPPAWSVPISNRPLGSFIAKLGNPSQGQKTCANATNSNRRGTNDTSDIPKHAAGHSLFLHRDQYAP